MPVVPSDNFINITRLLWFELWRPQDFFLKNLLLFPLRIVFVLTLPYESNPLILFCSQYIVIFVGLTLMFFLSFALLNVPNYYSPLPAISIVLVMLLLRFVRRFRRHEGLLVNVLCLAIGNAFNYLCIQIFKDLSLFLGFQLQ